jgi:uncharacterized membrane protein YvbJ
MVFCSSCGNPNLAGSSFCSKCGTRLVEPTEGKMPERDDTTTGTYSLPGSDPRMVRS